MVNKKIVLTELVSGIKITPDLQEAHSNALNIVGADADLGLLINDIGLHDRLKKFMQKGVLGVVEEYEKYQKLAQEKSSCGLACTQKYTVDNIETQFYISEFHNYRRAIRSPGLVSRGGTNIVAIDYPRYRRNKEREYWLEALKEERPQIFFETELRNEASRKIQKKRGKNWRKSNLVQETNSGLYLGLERVRTADKKMTCQGILLALYETLANKGYAVISQHFPEESKDAIIRAQTNYQHISYQSNKKDVGYLWKPAKFETTFYGGK